MKKKHLLYLLLLIGIMTATGCSSGGKEEIPEPSPAPTPKPEPKPEEPKPEISLSSDITASGLSFTNEEGAQTISFTTNFDWTISQTDGSGWCTPSTTQGSKGSASVTFTVKANEETEDRQTSITIKASTASKSFTITQEKKYVLTAKADKKEIGFAGGSMTVTVETNTEFEVAVSEDWIRRQQAESKALTTEKLVFEIDANTLHEQRKAEIILSNASKNLKQTLVITQDALPEDDTENPSGNIGDMTWG